MKPPIDLQNKMRAAREGQAPANGEQRMQIAGEPGALDPVFASAVNVAQEPDSILLEFLALLPHAGQGRLLKRIVMTPKGARGLAEALLNMTEVAPPVEVVPEEPTPETTS